MGSTTIEQKIDYKTIYEKIKNNVQKAIKKVKFSSSKTKDIICCKDLPEYKQKTNWKNYTLTSKEHLAAMLIKAVLLYVEKKSKDEEEKAKKLIKYINRLKGIGNDKFESRYAERIFQNLNIIESKLYKSIKGKNFEKIRKKAQSILKSVDLTNGLTEQNKEFVNNIIKKGNEIAEAASNYGTYEKSKSNYFKSDNLENVLLKIKEFSKNIKTICNKDYETTEGLIIAVNSQIDNIDSALLSPEKCYLEKIANALNDGSFFKEEEKKYNEQIEQSYLSQCDKSVVRMLLKAKERIVAAYNRIDKEEKERKKASLLPPRPNYTPPRVPTDGISDDPPPLRPVKTSRTQSQNPRKNSSAPTDQTGSNRKKQVPNHRTALLGAQESDD